VPRNADRGVGPISVAGDIGPMIERSRSSLARGYRFIIRRSSGACSARAFSPGNEEGVGVRLGEPTCTISYQEPLAA